MTKCKLIRISGLLLTFLIFFQSVMYAQTGDLATPVLKANAANDFNKGNYAGALEKYEILLGRYPRDGVFNYYSGLCLYYLKSDLGKAAGRLELAAGKPDVPVNNWYFSGLIYLKTYRFEEAVSSLEKYLQGASKQELRSSDASRILENAKNAIEFTRSYTSYDLEASSYFSFSDSNYIRQVYSTGGRLVIKPEELKSPDEQADDLVNYMFLPRILNNGDYVYFAGYVKGKKGGKELFRVKYLNGKRWGNLEPLVSLNTSFDEILPYFDPVGVDLYFASKGHKSMGGFDVYKSHYDTDRNLWSEPQNLGFPLNSPYDDLLVIPGTDLGSLLLVTGRTVDDAQYSVYSLLMHEPKEILTNAGAKKLHDIANFGEKVLPAAVAYNPGNLQMNKETISLQDNADVKIPEAVNKIDIPISYNRNLKEALMFQFKSDSLANLAREARLKAKEIADPSERWDLQKKIIAWEKDSENYQLKADELFRVIREMESRGEPAHSSPVMSVQNSDTVEVSEKDTAGYSKEVPAFPLPVEKDLPGTVTLEEEKAEEIKPGKTAGNNTSRFVVLEKSPYSENNPIPVDLNLPAGPFYAIQLGVFSQVISYDAFGGLSPITGETVPGKNLTRYYAGKFYKYEEASKALETVVRSGYKDAFIVAWYNGQKMPPGKVRELERRE